jgi:hypothetical protein
MFERQAQPCGSVPTSSDGMSGEESAAVHPVFAVAMLRRDVLSVFELHGHGVLSTRAEEVDPLSAAAHQAHLEYDLPGFRALAERAGFRVEQVWMDEQRLFGIRYLRG